MNEYFQREVHQHVPDAWVDDDKNKIGYELPFNSPYYVFKPPQELNENDPELKDVADRIVRLIKELPQRTIVTDTF